MLEKRKQENIINTKSKCIYHFSLLSAIKDMATVKLITITPSDYKTEGSQSYTTLQGSLNKKGTNPKKF